MTNVVQLPLKREAQGWICGCGGFNWVLYANGDCLCVECNCISTVITVVRTARLAEARALLTEWAAGDEPHTQTAMWLKEPPI